MSWTCHLYFRTSKLVQVVKDTIKVPKIKLSTINKRKTKDKNYINVHHHQPFSTD
jgi:hypothetical protein